MYVFIWYWRTHRGVEIDEDRTRDIFAGASLREESLERTALTDFLGIRVEAAISLESVFEEVAETTRLSVSDASILKYRVSHVNWYLQFPSAVPKLGTCLTDVKVTDLNMTSVSRVSWAVFANTLLLWLRLFNQTHQNPLA